LRLKILKNLRTASLKSEFTDSYKKVDFVSQELFKRCIIYPVNIVCATDEVISE